MRKLIFMILCLLCSVGVMGQNKELLADTLENAKRAAAIYEQQNAFSADYAIALYHLSDAYFVNQQYKEALAAQEKAVTMTGALYGETSNMYLSEIPRLRRLYELNGMQDKVDMLDMQIALMKKKAEDNMQDGNITMVDDIPDADFETTEEANAHSDMAKACADYVVNHYITSPQMTKAVAYVTKWAAYTDRATIMVLPESFGPDLSDDDKQFFLSIYMAGAVRYAIEHKQTDWDYEMYASAMADVLNSYYNHKEMKLIKSIPYFNKLLKADQNHHLDKYLIKTYKD